MLQKMKYQLFKFLAWLPIESFKNPAPVIGVIRFDGVIGRGEGISRTGITLDHYDKTITNLFEDKSLRAVAIVVNSPGGSPVQSELIAARIRELADENGLAVIAFCEDIAASGGYWIACAADEIFASANSIIGSIGVISAGFGFVEFMERFGIERRVYATGKRKGMLDPFQEEKEEDIDRLRELHEDIFKNFKTHVKTSRGDRLKASDEAVFTGDVWTGQQAVEVGLVDGLAELRTEIHRRFGKKTRFRRVDIKRGLLSSLRGRASERIEPTEFLSALDDWAIWKRFGL
tara:strand:+ start:96 stop:962 length:867 start_codon:yes stop_codon:yes gene_type:complete